MSTHFLRAPLKPNQIQTNQRKPSGFVSFLLSVSQGELRKSLPWCCSRIFLTKCLKRGRMLWLTQAMGSRGHCWWPVPERGILWGRRSSEKKSSQPIPRSVQGQDGALGGFCYSWMNNSYILFEFSGSDNRGKYPIWHSLSTEQGETLMDPSFLLVHFFLQLCPVPGPGSGAKWQPGHSLLCPSTATGTLNLVKSLAKLTQNMWVQIWTEPFLGSEQI